MGKISFAIDMGTTTIDCCLFDNENGSLISQISEKNQQSLYGRDVINRIFNSARNPSIKQKLYSIASNQLEKMILDLLSREAETADNIASICISGNTTMISILLKYDIETLGVAPFKHKLDKSVGIVGKDIFSCEELKDIPVILTGCQSAFIGGDVLSGIVYLNRVHDNAFASDKNTLLLDLGTNGEMVLNAGGKLYACSTACGPAFEGCLKKTGVYGSNLIDALCLLLKLKKVTKEGMLKEPYFADGIDVMNIHINMDLIRAFLMAKSAIYSGICSLCHNAGVKLEKVAEIYIAGGFGFYLNIDNAIKIGLIPMEFRDKIKIVGNTSLKGAMDIIRYKKINELDSLCGNSMRLIQLADDEYYKKLLIDNMIIGVHAK